MSYVDGFVIPVPTKNSEAYAKISKKAGKIWMEHGALEYIECVGDDMDHKGMVTSFPKALGKRGETIVFSWILYRSKAHRDAVNAKVMKDPRMTAMMQEGTPNPFDAKRMLYGGFKPIVNFQGKRESRTR